MLAQLKSSANPHGGRPFFSRLEPTSIPHALGTSFGHVQSSPLLTADSVLLRVGASWHAGSHDQYSIIFHLPSSIPHSLRSLPRQLHVDPNPSQANPSNTNPSHAKPSQCHHRLPPWDPLPPLMAAATSTVNTQVVSAEARLPPDGTTQLSSTRLALFRSVVARRLTDLLQLL